MQRQTRRTTYGRYSHSGILPENEERSELYISRESAGSAREKLRDNAYETSRMESPEPVLGRRQTVQKAAAAQKEMGFLDVLLNEYRRDKGTAVLCVFLLVMFIALGAIWMQKNAQVQADLRDIESFRTNEAFFLAKNAELEEQLAYAKSGERIRNLAQNQLGMLRRERADVQEIYIQMPDEVEVAVTETVEETRVELLDILLNLLNLFHIGQ